MNHQNVYNYHPVTNEEFHRLIVMLTLERGCNGDFNDIDTSDITDMSFLFKNLRNFNGDITHWNVSNVTNMKAMFQGAKDFNQDISLWDVSHVTEMYNMFDGADSLSFDISKWNFTTVRDVDCLFLQDRHVNIFEDYFPIQKCAKMFPNISSSEISPVISPK